MENQPYDGVKKYSWNFDDILRFVLKNSGQGLFRDDVENGRMKREASIQYFCYILECSTFGDMDKGSLRWGLNKEIKDRSKRAIGKSPSEFSLSN